MPVNLKELFVVLFLSALVFALGKRTALHFMEEADFKRRRNIWLILSAVAFLSPNVWIFSFVAAPILYWGARKDTHPLAFYLVLMNVIPSIPIQIPTFGLVNQLFGLDIFRLASFCVLIPAAWRLHKSNDPNRIQGLRGLDLLLIGFGVLKVMLYIPPDLPNHVILHSSFTNTLRDALLFVVDIYALYYVASRSASSRRAIQDALAAFCLAATVMASVAAFETLKHWLLYTDLIARWGGNDMDTAYLIRSGSLRAEASSGNTLALGYLLAVATGFWMYLQTHLNRTAPKIGVLMVLWLGLLATYSRGPLLGALLIFFAYAALRPGGPARLLKSMFLLLLVAGITLLSPIGDRIAASLPFLGGKVAASTLTYRELLVARAWQLIQAHPLLGDQLAYSHLQGMRQGQGIIDLVNTYVGVTLFYGSIGLAIFVMILLAGLVKAYGGARNAATPDVDHRVLGATLAAVIIGTMLMLADCSFILGYATMFFVLVGTAAGYARLGQLREAGAALPTRDTSPELS